MQLKSDSLRSQLRTSDPTRTPDSGTRGWRLAAVVHVDEPQGTKKSGEEVSLPAAVPGVSLRSMWRWSTHPNTDLADGRAERHCDLSTGKT